MEKVRNISKKTDSFFEILYSVDKKISILVKFIGYLSIILIPILIFVFAKFGLDLKEYFYGRQFTQAQQEVVASLKNRGYEATEEAALKALKDKSKVFDEYLKLGILPKTVAAKSALRDIFLSGGILDGNLEEIQGWFRRDNAAFSEIRPLIDDTNKFITSIKGEVPFSNAQQVCDALGANLVDGSFGFTFGDSVNCIESFNDGTIGAHVLKIIAVGRYWNDVTGTTQPGKVPTENIARIATINDVADQKNMRAITPITPQLFDEAVDGQSHRFVVDVIAYSPSGWIE